MNKKEVIKMNDKKETVYYVTNRKGDKILNLVDIRFFPFDHINVFNIQDYFSRKKDKCKSMISWVEDYKNSYSHSFQDVKKTWNEGMVIDKLDIRLHFQKKGKV